VATNASELLAVLAEPTRREIVERLAERPSAVSDIARDMPITRSAVSQHLQVLKAVGLVVDHAEGTRRVYQVDPDALAIIREYFDAFWKRSLGSFQRAAERTEEEQ
jgi:DNA-binding transcriptional ArsR family regulator